MLLQPLEKINVPDITIRIEHVVDIIWIIWYNALRLEQQKKATNLVKQSVTYIYAEEQMAKIIRHYYDKASVTAFSQFPA
jgi:hypothetical protein